MTNYPQLNHDRNNKYRGRPKQHELIGSIIEVNKDFLPSNSQRGSYNREYPVLIIIGRDFYSILKIYLKRQVSYVAGDEIDLEKYKSLFLLIQRLPAQEWASELQRRIKENLTMMIIKNEEKFVSFFNNAKPITTKLHQLRLLPGIGPKRMWDIIDLRKESLFVSFSDIEKRTKLDPVSLIVSRILEELETEQKYQLFTKKILPTFNQYL